MDQYMKRKHQIQKYNPGKPFQHLEEGPSFAERQKLHFEDSKIMDVSPRITTKPMRQKEDPYLDYDSGLTESNLK